MPLIISQPVHYYIVKDTGNDAYFVTGPLAAIVCGLNDDETANLAYFSDNGDCHSALNVPFVESPDGEEDGSYFTLIPGGVVLVHDIDDSGSSDPQQSSSPQSSEEEEDNQSRYSQRG